jgi:hypothetical protein
MWYVSVRGSEAFYHKLAGVWVHAQWVVLGDVGRPVRERKNPARELWGIPAK